MESERLLLQRIHGGEKEAFAELVRLCQEQVFTLAYGFFHDREEALEIVQETFMRVHAKIAMFRPEHSLRGWIYRLAHNLCIDRYRRQAKKRRRECGLDDVPAGQLPAAGDGRDAWDAQRLAEAIERVLAKLSLRQRSVFILKYRQGLKLQQVAEAMAVSLGTVKALHHRAIARMRRELAPGLGGENESMP
jgi:RNA polymerase sigma-70 factor (ECF subfamily)